MQNIIIFNQSNSIAGIYGIGTFVKLLVELFKQTSYKVYVVELNSKQKELSIKENKHFTQIIFPTTGNSQTDLYIIDVLTLYVNNINESVILFNSLPHLKFADMFRSKNIKTLHIGIIHSFVWIWSVKGKEKVLKYYLSLNNISSFAQQMKDFVNDEKSKFSSVDMLITLSKDSYKTLRRIYDIDKSKITIIPNATHNTCNKLSISEISDIKKSLH